MATFVVGPGMARAMEEDGTTPASDEIYVHGGRSETQWSEAMGRNGTIYRWVRATNVVYRYRPGGDGPASRLRRVIDAGFAKGWKRYAGPVIGEPEEFRLGDPGYDCSSFVSLMFKEALGVDLPRFTDAIAGATVRLGVRDALPGDIILYRYSDPAQPGVRYPHTGLWLGDGKMLDCQYPKGLGVHPLLSHPFEIHRPLGV